MPEGKQLSFQYGEVSPSLRYRSDSAFRSAALYKLRNGRVLKTGGVSNRQGFCYAFQHPYQVVADLPSPSSTMKMSIHTFVSTVDNEEKLLTYCRTSSGDRQVTFFNRNGDTIGSSTTRSFSQGVSAEKAVLTQVDDLIILTFGETNQGSNEEILCFKETSSNVFTEVQFSLNNFITGPSFGPSTKTGSAPTNLPFSLLLTAVLNDGTERFAAQQSFTEGHPHPTLSSSTAITGLLTSDEIRYYNIYRSAGNNTSTWGLVGSISLIDDSTTSYTFNDFVVIADILFQPPINDRLWGTQTAGYNWYDGKVLKSARRIMTYQQRTIISYDENDDDIFKKGTIGCSKLGAPLMLNFPNIPRNTEAFEFNVPIEKSSPVIHMLPMERAVLFTEENVLILMGADEQGTLIPTAPNPTEISSEGCSVSVPPRRRGTKGYYVNNDHTKLMRIAFSNSGQVAVDEISILSNHLFEKDLVDMAVTSSAEADNVYVLRRDGKLVCITVEEDFAGFSLIETDGIIESITTVSNGFRYWPTGDYNGGSFSLDKNDSGALACVVTRYDNNPARPFVTDRTRYIEILYPKDNTHPEGFNFMDASRYFGTRLVLGRDGKYFALTGGGGSSVSHYCNTAEQIDPISIKKTLGTNYLAGETTTLYAQSNLSTTVGAATYVDFYYDDEDGHRRTLRWTRTGSPSWDGGTSTFAVNGFFNADVPAQLQDVLGAPMWSVTPTYDTNALTTRWVIPVNQVTALQPLVGKEVSVFADGEVVSSPNNPSDTYPTLTVVQSGADGILTLPDYYGYGVVGLPYTFEMETLPIEPSDNRTLVSENKILNEATVALDKTRGGYYSDQSSADDVSKMEPINLRDNEDFDAPESNFSGTVDVNFSGAYDRDSRVKIKQVDPLPITVLAVYPKGVSGG